MIGLRVCAILTIVFSLVACEDDKPREDHRAQQQQKREKEKKVAEAKIVAVEQLFKAKRFPPKEFKAFSFTYSIQKYFEENNEQAHLFEGSVIDVIKMTEEYRATALVRVGSLLEGEFVQLNLSVPKSILPKLKPKSMDQYLRSAGIVRGDWIIARITAVEAVIQNETNVSGDREYVRSNLSKSRSLILKGILVDFAAKDKKEK